jgi:tungstate transport system ATP-binding protein
MPDAAVIPWSAPARAAAPVARLERVTVERAGRRLLDGLDLAVPEGGVTALMGPNGAGKSLALRLLAGLIALDEGRVSLAPAAEGRVAIVFQKPVLLRRSVRANLAHALALRGVPRAERRGRVAELLRLGRLEDLAETPARRLSGGEQARLAMVRALGLRPRLLLLDEPTAHLDPQATQAVEGLVRTATEDGVTVLIVTHDVGQARRLASDIAFVHRGRLAEQTPAEAFFRRPASAEGRAYLEGRLLV